MSDKEVKNCTSQTGCKNDKQQCFPATNTTMKNKLKCSVASPGYVLQNDIVTSCSQQPNCQIHNTSSSCIGPNSNILPCQTVSDPQKYEIINKLVKEKGCINVHRNPYPSTSPEYKVWGKGNCPNTLPSQATCAPICSPGYTSSGVTTCNKGTLTRAKCLPNSCPGTSVSGKLSTTPDTNPHSPSPQPQYNAWTKGNCGNKLNSGQSCQTVCSTGYITPGRTTCYLGDLTQPKCNPKPCPSGAKIMTTTTIGDKKMLTLHKELQSGSNITIPCSGHTNYPVIKQSPSWENKYTDNIILSCNLGQLTQQNNCKTYRNCTNSYKQQFCNPTNSVCNIDTITRLQTCKCDSLSVGDGRSKTKGGTGCTLCSTQNAVKDICNTITNEQLCKNDQNCDWKATSTPKCQIKQTLLGFKLNNGCICKPGYYKDQTSNTCRQCLSQVGCQTYDVQQYCRSKKNSQNAIYKYCSVATPAKEYKIVNGIVEQKGCIVSVPNNGTLGNCPVQPSELPSGSTCAPICKTPGYKPSGLTSCNKGTLTETKCNEIACSSITPPQNGSLGGCSSSLASQSTCIPTCSSGYDLSGVSKCNKGVFTSAKCIPGKCNNILSNLPQNNINIDCPNNVMDSGRKCNQKCKPGYIIQGPQQAECKNKKFTHINCVPEQCKLPSNGIPGILHKKVFNINNPIQINDYKNNTILDKSKYYLKCGSTDPANCSYSVICSKGNPSLIRVSPTPIKCSPPTNCSSGGDNICDAKTGKIKCTEEFTGTIEGFQVKDYQCSISDYNICKTSSTKINCETNKNCKWNPLSSPKCQIKHRNTYCKTLKTKGECNAAASTHKCNWGASGWKRGGLTKQGGCSDFYYLSSPEKLCKPNQCKCENGTPKPIKCSEHQDNQCIQCGDGYRLVDYNEYSSNIKPSPPWFGDIPNTQKSSINLTTRDQNYCLNNKCKCIPNVCICNQGTPNTHIDVDNHTNQKYLCHKNKDKSCKSCSSAYTHHFDRYCFPKCGDNQYIKQLPTINKTTAEVSQNKICANLTTCSVSRNEYVFSQPKRNNLGEYETNLICKPIASPCCFSKNKVSCKQYEETPPRLSKDKKYYEQNRICKQLDECKRDDRYIMKKANWDTTKNVFITNNECKLFKVCNKDQYRVTRGTKNQDGTLQSDTVCKKLSECKPGEFIIRMGGINENRECSKCPDNTFSIAKNMLSCSSMEQCGPGLKTDKQGTSTSNRTCKVCPPGKTSNKSHNENCLIDAPPTNCFCNNGVPVGNCKQKLHNCKLCSTGYVLKKIGDVHRCVNAKLSNHCNNGVISGDIKLGNAKCICIKNHFGGGPWNGNGFEKCTKKLTCSCPNGVGATNIPCGTGKRVCPLINSKGNLDKNGKPVSITCPEMNQKVCESCNVGFILDKNKQCIKHCPKDHWWDGKSCRPYTVCSTDEYEEKPPSKTNDRVCSLITKKCPPGETIIRKHTAKSDTICSGLQKQMKYAIKSKLKKPLKKCAPEDSNEITYNLCHLKSIKQMKISPPKLPSEYKHYILSVHSDNIQFTSMGTMMKQNFIRILKDTLYKKLTLNNRKDIILLSIQGDNPLRLDIAVKDPQDKVLSNLARKVNPLFLLKIVDIQKTSRMHITGIRKL